MANILNVYDTVYGNTREVAEIIEKGLKDHFVITVGVEHVRMDLVRKADFIIIGSPIQYWRPTAKIQRFIADLLRNRISEKFGAVYDTRLGKVLSGNAASKISKILLGLKFKLIRGENFFVDTVKGPLKLGEMDKGEVFAKRVKSFIENAGITEVHRAGFVL